MTEEEDKQQVAEETGHKVPKSKVKDKQVDFEGGEVEEHEEDEPEAWKIHRGGTKLATEVSRVLTAVKDFSFVNLSDLQFVTTNKDKKARTGKKNQNWHVYAEIMKPKPVFQAIADSQGAKLGPFVVLFRPSFFKETEKRQEQIIIHELFHLRFNENSGKVSLRPHWGFGDTEIEALQRKYLS